MREMGWSWQDLEATPVYVQRFCWDIAQIRRTNEAARAAPPPTPDARP